MMTIMAARRIQSRSRVRSGFSARPSVFTPSSAGITTSLQTIRLSAVVSTTTMLAAADSPPRKATSARNGCAVASGSDSTRLSGSVSVGSIIRPAMAIGRTNRLIASR